jgi:chemotaxis protein MotA
LFWAEAEVSEDEFRNLLETKADTYMDDHEVSVSTYKTITKFPTAFGMMGTVLGLIALLQSLSNPDAKSMIGPAMAVALVTTLYGLMMNNLYLIPVTDNLIAANQNERKVYDLCIEGLLLIQQRKPTKYIEEKLRAYLMPDMLGGPAAGARPGVAA